MNAELLPCPFCGAPAEDFNPDGDMEGYTIRCSGKGAIFGADSSCCPIASFSFPDHSEACKAWNTRATPTPPVEPVKEADVSAIRDAALEDSAVLDAITRDAHRYWWLREMGFDSTTDNPLERVNSPRELDSVIDAAIQGNPARNVILTNKLRSAIRALRGRTE